MKSDKHLIERKLLISCAQKSLSQEAQKHVALLLAEDIDWDYLLSTARKNGLLPLLAWNCTKEPHDQIPRNIIGILHESLETQSAHNMFLTKTLLETVSALEKNGIRTLPFKGPTLAELAYDHIALRAYCDLDILVPPKDFDRAVRIIEGSGFSILNRAGRIRRKLSFATRRKDVVLVNENRSAVIELHWKLSGSYFSIPLEIEELWARAGKIEIAGQSVTALDLDDLFVYLCLHGSRHGWSKFSWISDLNELMIKTRSGDIEVDWEKTHLRAVELGCSRVVEFALYLVARFFKTQADYPEIDRILNDKQSEAFATAIENRCFDESTDAMRFDERYEFFLKLREKPTTHLKLHSEFIIWYIKMLFRVNELDRSIIRLPAILFPLYYVLRPIRLLSTYISSKRDGNRL